MPHVFLGYLALGKQTKKDETKKKKPTKLTVAAEMICCLLEGQKVNFFLFLIHLTQIHKYFSCIEIKKEKKIYMALPEQNNYLVYCINS